MAASLVLLAACQTTYPGSPPSATADAAVLRAAPVVPPPAPPPPPTGAPLATAGPGPGEGGATAKGGGAVAPANPQQQAFAAPAGYRCKLPDQLELIVEVGKKTRLVAAGKPSFIADAIKIERGRHTGELGLPLASLIGKAKTGQLEIVPCQGDPLRFEVAALLAAPRRLLLTPNQRGVLKLIDQDDDYHSSQPLAKNLYRSRLIPPNK